MARPSTVVANWMPKLESWLSDRETEYRAKPEGKRTPTLPVTNDGMVNAQEVARQLGCARAYLYDYPEMTSLLDLFAEGQGLLPSGTRSLAAGDKAVKDKMAMVSKSAKVDAQAAVEAKAALSDAIKRVAELQAETQRLRLENTSLKEQIGLMHQGVRVRVQ
jgi:hypothetical protein